MSLRTTLILLALVGVLAGVWFLQPKPATIEHALFRGWDMASATRIVVKRPDSAAWTIERNKQGIWMLTDVQPPWRAKQLLVTQLLQALRESSVLRVLAEDAAPAELERFGLHPNMCSSVMVHCGASESVSLTLGAALGTGGVAARSSRIPAIVAVPAELLPLLFPERADCIDMLILPVNALDIVSIRFVRSAESSFSLDRRFSRWVIGSHSDLPADAGKCDRIRNSLAALRSLVRHPPTQATTALWDSAASANRNIVLTLQSGEVHTLELRCTEAGSVLARTEADGSIHTVDSEVSTLLSIDPAAMRDRRIVLADTGDIQSITVGGAEPANNWKLARTGQLWDVILANGSSGVQRAADALARARFIERLAGLHYEDATVQRSIAPVTALEVVIASGERSDRVQTLLFTADGAQHFSVYDKELGCAGRVAAGNIAFLLAPAWDMLERMAIGAGAYFAIGGIKLRIEGEGEIEVRTSIPNAGDDLQGALVTPRGLRSIPEEVFRPVALRLVAPTVKRFVGRLELAEQGFDRPLVDAAFYEIEHPSAEGIKSDAAGRWRSLRIGSTCAAEGFYARFDGDPAGLVFILEQQDLAVFSNLLRFARQ
ncbi:MAG: DUF4340 domain-containing protein [Planctomycetes bacterium]|nr:DUF4340 domain-containing protein [Planctomycetota bacterium]